MELTPREKEILYLIAYGKTNREIANSLFLSINTIDTYRRRLFMKLGANNAAGLVRRAFEEGVLPVNTPKSKDNMEH